MKDAQISVGGGRELAYAVMAGVTDMAWPDAWNGYLEGRAEVQLMRQPDERAVMAGTASGKGLDVVSDNFIIKVGLNEASAPAVR